ncbi:hypothetical protein V1514DRAFT_329785 [Lipomyces japonicus]|uniref:uncharacterized protein n=1 Tax=Lipomyces japonicus TaxID=56871 RepID=UPI0034CF0609
MSVNIWRKVFISLQGGRRWFHLSQRNISSSKYERYSSINKMQGSKLTYIAPEWLKQKESLEKKIFNETDNREQKDSEYITDEYSSHSSQDQRQDSNKQSLTRIKLSPKVARRKFAVYDRTFKNITGRVQKEKIDQLHKVEDHKVKDPESSRSANKDSLNMDTMFENKIKKKLRYGVRHQAKFSNKEKSYRRLFKSANMMESIITGNTDRKVDKLIRKGTNKANGNEIIPKTANQVTTKSQRKLKGWASVLAGRPHGKTARAYIDLHNIGRLREGGHLDFIVKYWKDVKVQYNQPMATTPVRHLSITYKGIKSPLNWMTDAVGWPLIVNTEQLTTQQSRFRYETTVRILLPRRFNLDVPIMSGHAKNASYAQYSAAMQVSHYLGTQFVVTESKKSRKVKLADFLPGGIYGAPEFPENFPKNQRIAAYAFKNADNEQKKIIYSEMMTYVDEAAKDTNDEKERQRASVVRQVVNKWLKERNITEPQIEPGKFEGKVSL